MTGLRYSVPDVCVDLGLDERLRDVGVSDRQAEVDSDGEDDAHGGHGRHRRKRSKEIDAEAL